MDLKTLRAIAEMIRCAARMHGVELTDVEFTICKPVDHDELIKENEDGKALC